MAPGLAPPSRLPPPPCAPLQNYELILREGTHKVVQRGPGGDLPYKVRYTGVYLTVETRSGMVVSWDRKTSVFIRLQQGYKVRVGGLGTPSGRDRSGPEGTVWQLTIHGGLGPVHSQCQLLKRQVLRPKGPTDRVLVRKPFSALWSPHAHRPACPPAHLFIWLPTCPLAIGPTVHPIRLQVPRALPGDTRRQAVTPGLCAAASGCPLQPQRPCCLPPHPPPCAGPGLRAVREL